MKKVFLCVLSGFALFSGPSSFAQYEEGGNYGDNSETRKLRFGAYIAPTISWMKPTANKSNNGEFEPKANGSKVGFIYGLMADYNFASNYAFSTGLQVNMTGGNILADRTGGPSAAASTVNTADFSYKLDYLEIPLALKLRTDDLSGFRFFGQLGLTTGFNIAKKASYSVYYINDNGQASVANGEKEKLKGVLAVAPVMFQMNIGAGTEYVISNKLAIYAGLFFNNGFAPDATNPNSYSLPYHGKFQDGNTRLNNLALRLGLFF